MSTQTKQQAFILELGTDYKNFKTWMFGSLTGSLADLATTNKSSFVAAINECRSLSSGSPADASESVKGIGFIASQADTNTGTNDTKFLTPLKFFTRLAAYAQPLSANLTSLAGVSSTAFGRARLADADAAAARTALGLSAVAVSGSASDITTGTLPSSVIPQIAIMDTFIVANQAAMLALSAQKGDIAKRTDLNGQAFILQTEPATTLGNWISLNTTSDVSSVNGQTGVVVVTKADVGLGSVDNTADSAKPVSSAQLTALNAKMDKSQNLNDLADKAVARTNLDVFAKSAFGDPDFDLLAAYTAAKAP